MATQNNGEKKGLTESFRSQTGYGTAPLTAANKKSTPKTRKYIAKKVQRTDTLIGISLKYAVSVVLSGPDVGDHDPPLKLVLSNEADVSTFLHCTRFKILNGSYSLPTSAASAFNSVFPLSHKWGVGGTVASESALRSAGTLLSRVRAPPPAPWPDGGPESLRSPCCGLAIYKTRVTNAILL
ncbi:hypothetical protein PoB_007424600 [Plakobranchus ocellatus]|uniref:PID domain-containing protein n=1 Tax=Plakobranchus ocellatus TaxID=259542 RepID=A0AAV4DUZ8_9GAST|nr:hypothetical protein PoB_007424600 [Plakobranchus ocellatus]